MFRGTPDVVQQFSRIWCWSGRANFENTMRRIKATKKQLAEKVLLLVGGNTLNSTWYRCNLRVKKRDQLNLKKHMFGPNLCFFKFRRWRRRCTFAVRLALALRLLLTFTFYLTVLHLYVIRIVSSSSSSSLFDSTPFDVLFFSRRDLTCRRRRPSSSSSSSSSLSLKTRVTLV